MTIFYKKSCVTATGTEAGANEVMSSLMRDLCNLVSAQNVHKLLYFANDEHLHRSAYAEVVAVDHGLCPHVQTA